MRKAKFVFFVLLVLCVSIAFPQGTSINTTGNPADPSAILDVSSTTQGALLPRLTETQRNAIVNPADGLIIFNTTTGCMNYYHNSIWFQWCGTCIPPSAPIAGNNGPVCSGDTLKLTASFIPNVTYNWTGPNGFTSAQQNPVIPNSSTSSSGTYSVTATISGCTSSASSTTATVNQTPSSAFTFNPTTSGINSNVTFTPSVSGASYSWTFQNGTPATSTSQNPVVQWAATGTYSISLVVTQNGCTSSTTTNTINVTSCGSVHGTQTFNYTGSQQTFTVPACVTSLTLEAWGGQGGDNTGSGYTGGLGGYAYGTLSVTPGQTIYIYVGGTGTDGNGSGSFMAGGWNGGGTGVSSGGGGGGGSDVRVGGTALTDRVLVAGGGGGAYGGSWADNGGYGGGLSGQDRQVTTGGTQSAGGNYGGSLGQGGSQSNSGYMCGGGGGGYYGGGAPQVNGTGSGGSSYYGGTVSPNGTTANVNSGNGKIVITW